MPRLMIFITEGVPTSLRGELTKWMLQLKPGVFLGTLSSLVGEKLWNKIQNKVGSGRAVWVKATNNEQRFVLTMCGNIKWKISDFDGLQLITHPNKKSQKKKDRMDIKNRESKESLTRKKRKSKLEDSNKKLEIKWDTKGTPMNFITRKASFKYVKSTIQSIFDGTSAYYEYPPEKLWQKPWIEDINSIAHSLMSFIIENLNTLESEFLEKKIVSLDIETTDYLPKAYEGFVNIIGISILNLENIINHNFSVDLFQAINMMRKKVDVPKLLDLVKPYLGNIDKLLVFNKDFDIKILNTIIDEFSLDITLPSNIIDLQDYFNSLQALEEDLNLKVGLKRENTEKGKYSEYYKLFKGRGKKGDKKQLEPISTYNLTDTLTPLYAYLVMKLKEVKN
ncbi:MAG: type I-E CRISPR-associated endoribonuclease Cas2e, partial [Candidatus Odinarchaeota archaeon]